MYLRSIFQALDFGGELAARFEQHLPPQDFGHTTFSRMVFRALQAHYKGY